MLDSGGKRGERAQDRGCNSEKQMQKEGESGATAELAARLGDMQSVKEPLTYCVLFELPSQRSAAASI